MSVCVVAQFPWAAIRAVTQAEPLACARKLLSIVNAVARDNAYWRGPDLETQHSC